MFTVVEEVDVVDGGVEEVDAVDHRVKAVDVVAGSEGGSDVGDGAVGLGEGVYEAGEDGENSGKKNTVEVEVGV